MHDFKFHYFDYLLASMPNYRVDTSFLSGIAYAKSGIKIKKENRGKFTEYCGGKVTQEGIERGKRSKDPKIRKRAVFAENARAWKHQYGGRVLPFVKYKPMSNIEDSDILMPPFLNLFTDDESNYFDNAALAPTDIFDLNFLTSTAGVRTTSYTPNLNDFSKLEEVAQSLYGIPYKFGQKTTKGIDCSGFTAMLGLRLGLNIKGDSQNQYNNSDRINMQDIKKGDLVFLKGTVKGRSDNQTSHVAIALSDYNPKTGTIDVAEASGDLTKRNTWNLRNGYYKDHYYGAGRVRQARLGGRLQFGGNLPYIDYQSYKPTTKRLNNFFDNVQSVINDEESIPEFELQSKSNDDSFDLTKVYSTHSVTPPLAPPSDKPTPKVEAPFDFTLYLDKYAGDNADLRKWLTTTAKRESGFNPNAKNPHSTAQGLFQMINATWAGNGGGDRADVDLQFKNMLTLNKKYELYLLKPEILAWMKTNGYLKNSVKTAMHYAGIGNILSLVRTGKLAKPDGVKDSELQAVLNGKYDK